MSALYIYACIYSYRASHPIGPFYHAVKGMVPSPVFSGSVVADTLQAGALVQYTRVGTKVKVNDIDINSPVLPAAEGGLQILDAILTEYTSTSTATTLSKEMECYRVWCEAARPRLAESICKGVCDSSTFNAMAYAVCKQAWKEANQTKVQLDPQECSKSTTTTTTTTTLDATTR